MEHAGNLRRLRRKNPLSHQPQRLRCFAQDARHAASRMGGLRGVCARRESDELSWRNEPRNEPQNGARNESRGSEIVDISINRDTGVRRAIYVMNSGIFNNVRHGNAHGKGISTA
jgi:hypothetical protein